MKISSAMAIVCAFTAGTAVQAADHSGLYQSNRGELRLHQIDDFLVGDYGDRGVIVGRVVEDGVEGVFTEGKKNGTFVFDFSQETFSGRWSVNGSSDSGTWNGTRAAEAPKALRNFSVDGSVTRTLDNDRTVFDGTFDSPYGTIDLIQEDLFLIGDYADEGVLVGMWDGDGFVGRFTSGARTGWFDLSFGSKNGTFRKGVWGWEPGEVEAPFPLERTARGTPNIDNVPYTFPALIEQPRVSLRPDNPLKEPPTLPVLPEIDFPSGMEIYDEDLGEETGIATLVLPGDTVPTEVHFAVKDGIAIMDGDIILGPVDKLEERFGLAGEAGGTYCTDAVCTARQPLNVISNTDALWPNGVIPYAFHSSVGSVLRNRVNAAATQLSNVTNLQVVPRQGQSQFVLIFQRDSGCSATLGRVGALSEYAPSLQRMILSPGCVRGTVMHEFLHAAGFTHEQQRRDRDQFVRIVEDNIEWFKGHNFKTKKKSTALGPYDFGSIMHYSQWAFAEDGCTSNACRTIVPRVPVPGGVSIGQRNGLSATDIAGVNFVYPGVSVEGGVGWGDNNFATAAAAGDMDGDGIMEFAVARRAGVNARVIIYRLNNGSEEIVHRFGDSWGDSNYATDVAFGDVDGDGRDEIGIARRAGVNSRFYVYDDPSTNYKLLHAGGESWGGSNYATSIAFGDTDGDGRDEVLVGRKASSNGRYFLLDDANAGFGRIATGGEGWGSSAWVTDVALGDIDGDGRDEVGVARAHGSNARFYVDEVTYVNEVVGSRFDHVFREGDRWGDSHYATSIAFGNVDGDPAEELLVGRRASMNNRFFLFDDAGNAYKELEAGGEGWGRGYWTTGVAIDDFDGDGRGELLVARNAGENGRVFLFDDEAENYRVIPVNDGIWPAGVGATDAAFGDIDGDGDQDVIVTRKEKVQDRPRFEVVISE